MSEKNSLILLLIAAVSALFFAYVAQYFFGYQPCILCLYQRLPFFAIIGVTSLSLISKKFTKTAFFCAVILLLINCAIAFYHSGVEQKIFAGPSICSANNLNDFDNVEDLENALKATKAVRCDEPQLFLLKLSMANWNMIYCALLASYFGFNFQTRTNRFFTINKQ